MKFAKFVVLFSALLALSIPAKANPILRLNTDKLFPIWAQTGTNGPTTAFFEAYNIGDGSLNLQVTGSYTWLTPALGASAKCTFDGSKTCIPVKVLLSSSSLAAGAYSGVVTVTDTGGAYDAPQRIRVTVYVGTNLPSQLDLYAPPTTNATDTATFQTQGGTHPTLTGTAQSGGNWLAVSTSGLGSFQFVYTHTVQAKVQNGMVAGDYNGTVTMGSSSFAADNKSFQTTFHVTTQPIARVGTTFVQLQGLQSGAAVQTTLPVANGGQGTLTISGATVGAGSPWLTASVPSGGGVQVTATPGSLAAGFYTGTVTIQSNAANASVTVTVEFEVQAAGPPSLGFGGVVDGATFLPIPVAAGAITSLFGSQLATGTVGASSIPLPTSLADATVFVNGAAAPLYFVSAGQINFQMPFEIAPGLATIRVDRQGQRGNTITVQVAKRGAGFFTFGGTQYAIAQNASRGNAFAIPDIPAFAGIPKAAAHPGDVLVLYGSGLGPVTPPVLSGTAAGSDPLSNTSDTALARFGVGFIGPSAKPAYVGLAPGFVGLYQVNVQIPPRLPEVVGSPTAITLSWPDGTASTPVLIDVEP